MKIALVSIFSSTDIHAWSGTGAQILSALQNAGLQTQTIGGLRYQYDFIYKTKEVFYTRFLSKTYRMLWDPILLKRFAAQVDEELDDLDLDVVFSIWVNPIAYLKTNKPIVFWGDATFAGLMERHAGYRNLCLETIKGGNKVEQLALSKCRLAIYSSEWAANTAVQYYAADPAKVKVVPFGANLTSSRTVQDIRSILHNKDFSLCKLLFVGTDWLGKGGDMALEIACLLNQGGLQTELHVVGCNPPGELPGFVRLHGFISKATEEGRQLLDDLFAQAHFFILPTRADCTPIVFPEASSFGLPVLTTAVGGIPTVIQDGKNGFTFSLEAGPAAYCDVIQRLWSSRSEYEQLALSSFQEYAARLNWATAGRQVYHLLQEYCQ